MSLHARLATVSCVALVASLGGAPAAVPAGSLCDRGYDYAGVAGVSAARGVAATLSIDSEPLVGAGHVAAWVGVGGRGLGAGGTDAWIQAGLNAFPDGDSRLYSEVAKPGGKPMYRELARVRPGEHYRIAVAMDAPERWSILLDGRRVAGPVRLAGSARWRPVATAESWSPTRATCNRLGYRFGRVTAIPRTASIWKPLTDVAVLDGTHYTVTRTGASFVASSRP